MWKGLNRHAMDQRLRTDYGYNLQLLKDLDCEEDWLQMPIVNPIQGVPTRLVGFNYALTSKEFDKAVHFYLDDYQFERVWRIPEKYIKILRKFDYVFTPDFSLYMDMPKAQQIYNIYRSRLLGAYWQSRGINVIPTLSWSDEQSFDFVFDGLRKGGTVTISTVGVIKDKETRELWIKGANEAIKRLEPKSVIVYGTPIEFDSRDTEVINFKNTNTERFR